MYINFLFKIKHEEEINHNKLAFVRFLIQPQAKFFEIVSFVRKIWIIAEKAYQRAIAQNAFQKSHAVVNKNCVRASIKVIFRI